VSQPEPQPLKGKKDLEKAIATGRDFNKDLDKPQEEGDTETRSEAAVALRIGGASYTDIARTLKYSSPFVARQAVERALANSAADAHEDRERQRQLISRRFDRLLQSVMGKAVNPRDPDHLAYNQAAFRIIDRQAKLFGVDAPQESIIYTPRQEEVERYIAQITALASNGEGEEADILDVEGEWVDEEGEPE